VVDTVFLPVGKLPPDILAKMLKAYTFLDERVIPRAGSTD
jgi:hypothetical protein